MPAAVGVHVVATIVLPPSAAWSRTASEAGDGVGDEVSLGDGKTTVAAVGNGRGAIDGALASAAVYQMP